MLKEDVLKWLFQLIVDHTEKMEEDKRLVRRLEAGDEGLDLITKHGRHFRIIVRTPANVSETEHRNHSTATTSISPDRTGKPWSKPVNRCCNT
jgi:hypothetical protein